MFGEEFRLENEATDALRGSTTTTVAAPHMSMEQRSVPSEAVQLVGAVSGDGAPTVVCQDEGGSRRSIVLVACVATKQPQHARAEDLYISPWFRKARDYARLWGSEWRILSAVHHLVHPQQDIEPYEQTLPRSLHPRTLWAATVCDQISATFIPAEHCALIFLAGERYTQPLATMLREAGYQIRTPLAGLRIGEQLNWLARHTSPGKAQDRISSAAWNATSVTCSQLPADGRVRPDDEVAADPVAVSLRDVHSLGETSAHGCQSHAAPDRSPVRRDEHKGRTESLHCQVRTDASVEVKTHGLMHVATSAEACVGIAGLNTHPLARTIVALHQRDAANHALMMGETRPYAVATTPTLAQVLPRAQHDNLSASCGIAGNLSPQFHARVMREIDGTYSNSRAIPKQNEANEARERDGATLLADVHWTGNEHHAQGGSNRLYCGPQQRRTDPRGGRQSAGSTAPSGQYTSLGDEIAAVGWRHALNFLDYTYVVAPTQRGAVTVRWREGRDLLFGPDRRTLPLYLDSAGYRRCITRAAPQWADTLDTYAHALELTQPDGAAAYDYPDDRAMTLDALRLLAAAFPHLVAARRLWPVFSIRWVEAQDADFSTRPLPALWNRLGTLDALIPLNTTQPRFSHAVRERWVREAIATALVISRDPDFREMLTLCGGQVMLGGMVRCRVPRLARHVLVSLLTHLFPAARFWALGQAHYALINGCGYLGTLPRVWTDSTLWLHEALCGRAGRIEGGLVTLVHEGASFFTTAERAASIIRSLLGPYAGVIRWPDLPQPIDLRDLEQREVVRLHYQVAQYDLWSLLGGGVMEKNRGGANDDQR